MSDNFSFSGVTVAAKDIGGVEYPRNILTDANGLDLVPLTDVALRAAPVVITGTVAVTGNLYPASQPVTGTFWQTTQPVSIASMPTTPVTGTFWQTTQPVSGTFFQATQPVSLATNTPTLAAGTNAIGGVTQKVVATTPGATLLKVNAAATTNAASVKASAGNLFQWQITNIAAYAVYVSWFNKNSAPVPGTDTPLFQVIIPPGGIVTMPHGPGIFFSTGIAVALTKSDNTALAAGDVVGHALYA